MLFSTPTKMEITLTKDLEILLVVANSECVDNIIHSLKSVRMESDVFWLKHPDKAVDFVESRGAYAGKAMTNNPKFFVFDARFGIDDCRYLIRKVRSISGLENSPFFVLAKGLPEEELREFRGEGIYIIDEHFKIESIKPIPNPLKIFDC